MYLSYTEYTEMGGQLTENEFNRLNFTAQAELDLQTFHRITEADERVKQCIFALIGVSEVATNISSVSNDGYSISYKSADEMSAAQSDIIYKFFADTDLMYRGADGDVGSYMPTPEDGYEYLQVKKQ
jgi:hypothetical protein